MENPLFSLKSIIDIWLSSSSTSWAIAIILTVLCGLGFFFMLLACLQSNPSLPPARKHGSIKKRQVEPRGRSSRTRKKSGALRACRDCLKELEEARGLVLLVQSHLDRLHDKGGFPQLSRQDAPGKVGKAASAGAHQPRGEQMEDAAPAMSLSASPAPLTKCPLPLACTLSAEPQEDQSDLPRIPLGTVAKSSPPGNSGLASPISGLVHTSCPILFLSQWWKVIQALLFPTSSQPECQQERLSHRPLEDSPWGALTDRQVEAGSPSFVNPDVQKMLNIQITKRVELVIWNKKENDGAFAKHMSSDFHLTSSGNMWKAPGAEQDTTSPHPFWTMKDKPEQLLSPRQLSYPKVLGDHLQQKCSQLYWGLPSLHSESLVATILVSRRSSQLQASSVSFNGISHCFPVPVWPKISSRLSQAPPLPHSGAQPQPLAQTQTQNHLPSSLPIQPPSSPPQMGTCGVSFPAFQNEAQSFIPTKIHLEFSLLQKQLERERALPSVVKRSEEVFCQLIPNLPQDSGASHTHKSVSTLPGDFISSNLQKQHLQKRLIKDEHQGVLPQEIQVSLELMRLQEEFLVAYQAQGKQAPSRPSAFADKGSKDTQKMGSRCPRKSHGKGQVKLQLGKDFSKGLGQCLQRIPEDLSRGSASFPVKVLGMNSEESEKHLLRPSKSDSGNCLPRGPDEKHLEKVLEVHLGRKSIQIKESLIPVSVRRSWLAANYAFPKSHTHTETGNPASWKGQEPAVNTSCGHSVLSPHTRQVLEAHITKLRVLHKWGLPLKVLKPIKLLKLKKVQPSPLPRSAFPPSAACASGAHSKASFTTFSGKSLQPHPREKLMEESVPTLASPLPAPSPVREEIQEALGGTPPGDGPSEAPLAGQEGRPPPQSLTKSSVGRNWHSEPVMGAEKGRLGPSPSSAVARGEPREGSGRQASRDPCRSSSSQREHTSEDTPASQVPYDLIPSGKTSQGQQQPRIPKAKDPRKSQSKIFVPTDERNDYRRPKPGECEERFAGLRASQASEMSRPSQVRGTGDTTGSKCFQLLLEKGHSSHFRKEMQHFLQHLDPSQKDKRLEDLPPKGEPASATAQSPGPVTSSVKDGGAGEAQMIATSVGQILAETLRLHQGLCGSEKWQHKEQFQAPGSGHSHYQGAISSPEQRRVMTNTVYSHKATSGVHGCPNKSRWTRERDGKWVST
ncbi:spermatogenesis-associated protein 31E1-like [Equus przewalskii]|uniref:Spermatogenesis-associated protein 31E1-like n=1 Tax=Equus przewalskii TaxID=9798 RepID=A0ABM2EGF1_EQUPR